MLDSSKPDIAIIIQAILQARDIVGRHSWGSPQEPIDDCWWADVLADPRTRTRRQSRGFDHVDGKPAAQRAYYTLADEPRPTISVACTKCEWKADFSRAELITMYGLDYPLPNLLNHLASPTCAKVGNQWDRCGAYYVNPIG